MDELSNLLVSILVPMTGSSLRRRLSGEVTHASPLMMLVRGLGLPVGDGIDVGRLGKPATLCYRGCLALSKLEGLVGSGWCQSNLT